MFSSSVGARPSDKGGGGEGRGGHPDPGIKGGERCEKCFFNHFPLGSLTYYVACITVAL